SCSFDGTWKRCGATGITLGWGGPRGLTRYYFTSNPQRWTRLVSTSPATAYMSPHVDWISLRQDLPAKSVSQLTTSVRNSLITEYDRLAGDLDASMTELVAFLERLASLELVGNEDRVFKQLAQDFYASNASSLEKAYQPRYAVF